MHVLLVDDEKELASTLAERLSMRGFQTSWVSTAEEALAIVAPNRFDVAVLDVKMPGMGGIELLKKMEALAPGLRFVLMTGHGSMNDYLAGQSAGVPYLAKPLNIQELITILNRLAPAEGSRGADHA